jgi:hypothetical protein
MTQTDLHKFYQAEEPEELKLGNSMIKVMEQHNNADFAQFLEDKGLINAEESNRIKEMIYSPDPENYEVAKVILMEKSNGILHGYRAHYPNLKTLGI